MSGVESVPARRRCPYCAGHGSIPEDTFWSSKKSIARRVLALTLVIGGAIFALGRRLAD